MRYLLILCFFLLSLKGFAQQSALDSIAIKIQSYINQNGISLESRSQEDSYVITYVNDSLYLDSCINFIRSIEFDKSKLKDSFEYHLKLINNPITDTAIVDIYQGWKLSDAVFPEPGCLGQFSGGLKKHSKDLYDYIQNSGITINDSVQFTIYFGDKAPIDVLYVHSKDSFLADIVMKFYNSGPNGKYYPPIRNGRLQFSSHLLNIYENNDRKGIVAVEYNEYESLFLTDEYIYSLSILDEGKVADSIFVFDRKKDLNYHFSSGFLSQFSDIHHSNVKELIKGLYSKGGKPSALLKINIIRRYQ